MDLTLLTDGKKYIEHFLKIKTKAGTVTPFRLNKAQERLYDALMEQDRQGKPMRAIVLKARQLGFSTLTEGLIFHRAATRFHQNALIVAHQDDSTRNLFEMSRRYLENLPEPLRPMTQASNAQEIVFNNPNRQGKKGLDSQIRCQTAGGRGIGRSATLQMVHASEFAFWPGDKLATWVGIMQAVPAERGTLVIVESTANGYDAFHDMWEAAVSGESDFIPMFFPWFENEGYRKRPEPDTVWTEEERELQRRFGLDEEQMAWRRWCIRNNCGGDVQRFRQEYPSYPEEAFLTSGQNVFDQDSIAARLMDAPEPERTGEFIYTMSGTYITGWEWTDRENGSIRIYRQPERGRPYVLGGDTAGTGSDWFTGQVIDNITGRQAAALRRQYDEDEYARQMYCLGMYYNHALIGVEVNYSTYPVKMLDNMRYPKLYVRELPDTFKGTHKDAYGWDTNGKTRPIAIAELVMAFREDPEMVSDRQTLKEMQTFQFNERRRPEAMPGEHDDLVMALAIANAIRGQQDMTLPRRAPDMTGWTADMWEDYRKADPKTQAYLRERWGTK